MQSAHPLVLGPKNSQYLAHGSFATEPLPLIGRGVLLAADGLYFVILHGQCRLIQKIVCLANQRVSLKDYRRSWYFHLDILDSLTAWLAGVQLKLYPFQLVSDFGAEFILEPKMAFL